jgi:hypothetical protein
MDAKWSSFNGSADCDRSSGQRLNSKLERSIASSVNRTCSAGKVPMPHVKPALCGSRAAIHEAVRRPSDTACQTVALLVRVANLDWSREARGVERRPVGCVCVVFLSTLGSLKKLPKARSR